MKFKASQLDQAVKTHSSHYIKVAIMYPIIIQQAAIGSSMAVLLPSDSLKHPLLIQ